MNERFRLTHNPFPPAATGVVSAKGLPVPDNWQRQLEGLK